MQDGCCKNFTLDDGGLSGTVDLVAGNQYYMESLLKEGGGGDWMTVAWRMPSEGIDNVPGGNQEGISGEYFTGKVTGTGGAGSERIGECCRRQLDGSEGDSDVERDRWSHNTGHRLGGDLAGWYRVGFNGS